jgi:gluconokinase
MTRSQPTDHRKPYARPHAAGRRLIVMGVSGCGKSTVGKRVAASMGWRFLDGDSLHPPANVAKMHAGKPLDDADRWPWLKDISEWMDARVAAGESAVIACSALKRCYRDYLGNDRADVCFAWLKVERAELERRLRRRSGHFMAASLLASQLATLEPPECGEPAFTVDAGGDVEATVHSVITALKAR